MGINAILSFFLEIAAIVAYGWVPFSYAPSLSIAVKIIISIVLVLVVTLVWSKYAAPRSTNRLKGLQLIALKLLVFLPATVVLGIKLGVLVLVIGLIIVCGNLAVEYIGGSRPSS